MHIIYGLNCIACNCLLFSGNVYKLIYILLIQPLSFLCGTFLFTEFPLLCSQLYNE